MKKLILLELCLLFLATTFRSDRMTGWVQQTIPRPDLAVVDLSFTDTLNGFLISSKYSPSDSGFIFRTSDGGQNWSTAFVGKVYLTSIQFVNNLTGYCAGRDTIPINGLIKKTTNGGLNWYSCTDIYNSGLLEDVFFPNKDTGWVCSTDIIAGGLWRTVNGGLNWQIQLDYNVRPSKIFFVNPTTGWVIGNAGLNLYKTTNSGNNWFLQANIFNASFYDVFFTSLDTGWIIRSSQGNQLGLMRSTNGGDNWHGVNSPLPPTETRLFFIGARYGWGGSLFHKIYATKDGYNWGTQYSPLNRSDNISFTDTLHGWAGYSGLVHTNDGGGQIVNVNNQGTGVPEEYVLYQNYPNPFNSITNFKFQILNSGNIKIILYGISGKEIKSIVNERRQAGVYEVKFDAGNLSSGVYFYALYADGKRIDTKKMVLVK